VVKGEDDNKDGGTYDEINEDDELMMGVHRNMCHACPMFLIRCSVSTIP
jgi:NAD-dependent dihydropyrimidine dehydrogenase PreA subunit